MMLNVIIPAYNEEKMIEITTTTISNILEENNIPFELLFVDDGSGDNTWFEIVRVCNRFKHVKGIHFSRNFGKESAIAAGLSSVDGDCCVVIDCDLQHPPEKIVEMYKLWQEGYEVVEGVKNSRGKECKIHTLFANNFYSIICKITGFHMEKHSDFKLLDKKVVDILKGIKEKNGFFRAMSSWVGFKTTAVGFDVQDRVAGTSKWSTIALIKYAINNITSFSAAPMQIVTILGFLTLVISLIFGGVAIIQKFKGTAHEGFTTVILLLLLLSSIIMISIGTVGYYISRIFEEVKNRPLYIISEKCGGADDEKNNC